MTYPIGTDPSPERRIEMLQRSNAFLRREAVTAGKRAEVAFWRGVAFGAAVVTIGMAFTSAAFSLDISGSTVTLEPSADPAAFADVVFRNDLSNGPIDTGRYTLSEGGTTVQLEFVWDVNFIGMDRITVIPPQGMTCRPADCGMSVIEGTTGRVTLFEFVGF